MYSIWDLVFDCLAGLPTAGAEHLKPGMKAGTLGGIRALQGQIVELLGICVSIVGLTLTGHVLDVAAVRSAQRQERGRTRLIPNARAAQLTRSHLVLRVEL